MKYYYEHDKPRNDGAKFIKCKDEQLNPLRGLTFAKIVYYQKPNGKVYGVVM